MAQFSVRGACGFVLVGDASRTRLFGSPYPLACCGFEHAGLGSAGKLLDSNIDDLESMIYLNVTALTRLALAALPGFVARKNGLLINIFGKNLLKSDFVNCSC